MMVRCSDEGRRGTQHMGFLRSRHLWELARSVWTSVSNGNAEVPEARLPDPEGRGAPLRTPRQRGM